MRKGQSTIESTSSTARCQKGQAATEYLIILAVVVIIALIVVGVLGGFQGLTGGITEQQSATYWAGAEIGIQPNYRLSIAGAEITVKNNRPFTVKVEEVKFGGVGTITGGAVTLNPGSTADVLVDTGATAGCTKGTSFSYNVSIVYVEPTSGRNFSVAGATPLVGTCQ